MHIAIDGPAGSGKSTVAKILADKLNLTYIDTGAMYRAITLKIIWNKINLNDPKGIQKLMENTSISIRNNRVFLDNKDVSNKLRTPEVNKLVSQVSKIKKIRQHMVKLQKEMARDNNVIMDGRDIATRVLPDADFKFFLTASLEERAKRRAKDLKEAGYIYDFEQIKEEIKARDKMDIERRESPLRKAKDAVLINTTNKSIQEVVDEILSHIKGGKKGVL